MVKNGGAIKLKYIINKINNMSKYQNTNGKKVSKSQLVVTWQPGRDALVRHDLAWKLHQTMSFLPTIRYIVTI